MKNPIFTSGGEDLIQIENQEVSIALKEDLIEATLEANRTINDLMRGDEDLNNIEILLLSNRETLLINYKFLLMAIFHANCIHTLKLKSLDADFRLDPIDRKILELVGQDPDLNDTQVAQQLKLSRQAVNTRRQTLKKMGFTVR